MARQPRPFKDMPKTAEELEQFATNGLIDRMLQIRTFPPPTMVMSDDPVRVWRLAVDACLDLLVPSLKDILLMPATSGQINQSQVAAIIGRVPLTRDDKGWR